jgi:uncharacterized protein YdhG (YjbR/CyaY superfamily)
MENMISQVKIPKTIDEYIAGFPVEVQAMLETIRAIIREEAPQAVEGISYLIPTFSLGDRRVHFAAYKKFISLYPAPRGEKAFKQELAGYQGGKGTVRFPLDEPIPYELVRRIVRFGKRKKRISSGGGHSRKP